MKRLVFFPILLLLSGCGGASMISVTPASIKTVAVSPASTSAKAGQKVQFTALGTYKDGTTLDITNEVAWSSSSSTVATVSNVGQVTAMSAGTSVIKAELNGVTGASELTVTSGTTSPTATLVSIAVSPASTSVAVGANKQLTATGTYSDGTTQNLTSSVTWSSSASNVASVSSTGVVSGKSAGSSTIQATSNSVSGSSKLTVTASSTTGIASLVSLSLSPASSSIAVNATKRFSATGTYSDGSTKNLTSTVTWSSSATSVATITASGRATGVSAGSATITATSGSISASATLTVTAGSTSNPATMTSISVTPAASTVTVGAAQQYNAIATYSDGSTNNVTSSVSWSSSASAIASINASGVASGVSAGTATITATSGSISGTAALTVDAATTGPVTMKSITVTPGTASVSTGSAQQFAALATYTDGSTKYITATATWSSSSTAVATIAASGLATGVTEGTTTITASSGSLSGSALLTISNTASVGGCDGLGNCYIYASAKGSGNGSSWANAYTGFGTGSGQVSPAKMQRGVTYWIANGNYGAQNFTTPASGTQLITIEGATSASHGPATDWSDSYAGKAVFGGGQTGVFTGYWDFEGQTRGSDWQSGYTIMFDLNGVSGKSGVITNRDSSGKAASNLFFDYVEVRGSNMNFTYNSGSSSNCSTYCDGGFYTGSPTNNLYVGHSWIHDVGDTQFQSNINDSSANSNGSGWIIEYNYISRDHTGDQANGAHSEAFSSTVQNMTVRYNYFQDILSSGVITDASGGNPDVGPWFVYGNIVFWTDNAVMTSNSTASGLGDGFVSFFGGTVHGTSYIVHNTIANLGVQPHCSEQGVACAMYYLYASGSGSASWVIENNLVWNAHGSCVYNGGASWTITSDYNSHYGGPAGTMSNCGSNAQTVSNTNPFVNWDGSGTQLVPYESLDFSTTTDTSAGNDIFSSLPAGCTPGVNCMNVDMNGKVFGSSGTYDRGALQK